MKEAASDGAERKRLAALQAEVLRDGRAVASAPSPIGLASSLEADLTLLALALTAGESPGAISRLTTSVEARVLRAPDPARIARLELARARALRGAGDFAGATAAARRGVQAAPVSTDAHQELAQALAAAGRVPEALQVLATLEAFPRLTPRARASAQRLRAELSPR